MVDNSLSLVYLVSMDTTYVLHLHSPAGMHLPHDPVKTPALFCGHVGQKTVGVTFHPMKLKYPLYSHTLFPYSIPINSGLAIFAIII